MLMGRKLAYMASFRPINIQWARKEVRRPMWGTVM
jgi:hypothetical protein